MGSSRSGAQNAYLRALKSNVDGTAAAASPHSGGRTDNSAGRKATVDFELPPALEGHWTGGIRQCSGRRPASMPRSSDTPPHSIQHWRGGRQHGFAGNRLQRAERLKLGGRHPEARRGQGPKPRGVTAPAAGSGLGRGNDRSSTRCGRCRRTAKPAGCVKGCRHRHVAMARCYTITVGICNRSHQR